MWNWGARQFVGKSTYLDMVNTRRLMNEVKKRVGDIVGSVDDPKSFRENLGIQVGEYLDNLKNQRGISHHGNYSCDIAEGFSITDTRRGPIVNYLGVDGKVLMTVNKRSRRIARKFGRGIIGSMIVGFEVRPVQTTQLITFKVGVTDDSNSRAARALNPNTPKT